MEMTPEGMCGYFCEACARRDDEIKRLKTLVLDERNACAEIAHKVAMHYYAEHVDPDRVWGTGTEAYTACEEIEKAIKERT